MGHDFLGHGLFTFLRCRWTGFFMGATTGSRGFYHNRLAPKSCFDDESSTELNI